MTGRETGSDALERAKTTAGSQGQPADSSDTVCSDDIRGGMDCDNPCHNHDTSAENQQP